MESVLQNCVILDRIAAHLGPSDLKNCRLVCKQWNESSSMTRLLGRRGCILRLRPQWCKSKNVFQIPIKAMQVDSRLTKILKINPYHGPRKSEKCVNKDVDLFLEKFQAGIEFLEFRSKDDCTLELIRILNKFDFPLLEKISITEYGGTEYEGEEEEDEEELDLRPMSNLKIVKFDVEEGYQDEEDDRYHPIYDVVQAIINSATNLDELWIGPNFLPDLSGCKKLTKLSLSVVPFSFERGPIENGMVNPEFSMDDVNTLLMQVQDSVEELELNDRCADHYICNANDRFKFQLPQMTKLRDFRNMATDIFITSEFLNSKYLPNLTSVSMASFYEEGYVNTYLKNLMKTPFPTVRAVSLFEINFSIQSSGIDKIKVVFPNLERFTMHAVEYHNHSEMSLTNITGLFGAFKNWNLKSLEIILKQRCKFSNVLLALHSLPYQETKKVTIWWDSLFLDYASDQEGVSLTVKMRQAMMQTQSLDRLDVVGVMLRHPLVKAARDFTEKNKLPIYFSSLKWTG